MKCKQCGKEVTHYYFTKKQFCDSICEERYQKKGDDAVDQLRSLLGIK